MNCAAVEKGSRLGAGEGRVGHVTQCFGLYVILRSGGDSSSEHVEDFRVS